MAALITIKYRILFRNGKCMLMFSNNLSKTKTNTIMKVKMIVTYNAITR